MNKFFKTLSILSVMVLFASVFGVLAVQAHSEKAAPAAVAFESVLGKSLTDQAVAEFIASNNCTSAGSFQLCEEAGMALWMDSDRLVKTVYLYPSGTDGFQAFTGELPLRLAANDTMASVEQKLGSFKVAHAPQAGWVPGLPDEGGTPDHVHYHAVYNRFGVTIVYNSPVASDKGATIQAILVRK
jgi:hypothetical protein